MAEESGYLAGYLAWYRAHYLLNNYTSIRDLRSGSKTAHLLSLGSIINILWLACLFIVCEYLKKDPSIPPELLTEIDKIYKPLKRFRDAVFHQSKTIKNRSIDSFLKSIEYTDQAIVVHYKIRDYFRNHKYSYLLPSNEIEEFAPDIKLSLN